MNIFDETTLNDKDDVWVMTDEKYIAYLKGELKTACRYLYAAKIKWNVNTTNSEVDDFLKKWGANDDDDDDWEEE